MRIDPPTFFAYPFVFASQSLQAFLGFAFFLFGKLFKTLLFGLTLLPFGLKFGYFLGRTRLFLFCFLLKALFFLPLTFQLRFSLETKLFGLKLLAFGFYFEASCFDPFLFLFKPYAFSIEFLGLRLFALKQ